MEQRLFYYTRIQYVEHQLVSKYTLKASFYQVSHEKLIKTQNFTYLPISGDGMQRGTLFTGNGDPLTPMYPSTSKTE